MQAERDADRGDRRGGDIECVEDDEVGAILGATTNDRDQPTVAFGGIGRSGDEERFFGYRVRPSVEVGEFTGVVVEMPETREGQALRPVFQHGPERLTTRTEVVVVVMTTGRPARVDHRHLADVLKDLGDLELTVFARQIKLQRCANGGASRASGW